MRVRPALPHRPLLGVALRLLATLMLAIMFALVKRAAEQGVHVVESLFFRQLTALPLILGWMALTGERLAVLKTARLPAHARRTALGVAAMILNFTAVVLLPLPEATAIGYSVPIFGTLLAVLLLGEAVGRHRWSAIIIGFVGVLIITGPFGGSAAAAGSGHLAGVAVALVGAFMTALVSVAIRDLGRTEAPMITVFWFSLLSMLPLGLALPFFVGAHAPMVWGLIAGLSLAGALAQLLLTAALRLAPVAIVLPVDYVGLVWAALLGWWLFDQAPALATWAGAALVIASGLTILWREQRRGTQRSKADMA